MLRKVNIRFVFVPVILLILVGCVSLEELWREKAAWESASEANTLRQYEAFLELYPYSDFAPEAKSRIALMRWAKAQDFDTLEGYHAFLAGHTTAELCTQAVSKVERFQNQILVEVAEAKTVSVKLDRVEEAHKNCVVLEHLFDEEHLSSLLGWAGLTLATSDSDVVLFVEYEAMPRLEEWYPIGNASSLRLYYTAASVNGHICIGNEARAVCLFFSGSTWTSRGASSNGQNLTRDPNRAPYGRAFIRSELPHMLVYLLSLGKGTEWTPRVSREIGKTSFERRPFLADVVLSHWYHRPKVKPYQQAKAESRYRNHLSVRLGDGADRRYIPWLTQDNVSSWVDLYQSKTLSR